MSSITEGKAGAIVRIAAVALFASRASLAMADSITLSTIAPTIGFGPSFPINTGGPSFTYTPSSGATITLSATPLILDTSTQNFGQYIYSASPLTANALTVTLDVIPTVNGVTDTTPLVFTGTLETGLHIITQPAPYLISFDPALNPSSTTAYDWRKRGHRVAL